MKTLITGNKNYGLAKAVSEVLPCSFASRSNGFDLCNSTDRQRLAEESLNYDVFINCAALWRFNQTLVLQDVWNLWEKNAHQGHIINIGSTADVATKATAWAYPIEKKALREQSANLALMSVWSNTNIRVSYISLGSLDTDKVKKKHPDRTRMSLQQAAEMIAWVVNSPNSLNINSLHVDPIQQGN